MSELDALLRKRLVNPLVVGAIVVVYFVLRLWRVGTIDKFSLIIIAVAGAIFPVVIALIATHLASKSKDRTGA